MRLSLRSAAAAPIAFVLALAVGAPALAQNLARTPDKDQPSHLYILGPFDIDGHVRRPGLSFMTARKRAEFQRLLDLKRSFTKEIKASVKDPVLK